VALLHHVGKLFQLFSDWGTPMAPRQHCFVATPAVHLGRTDVVVLGASTTNGDSMPEKLELWLVQFALWFHPEALKSEPPKVGCFYPFNSDRSRCTITMKSLPLVDLLRGGPVGRRRIHKILPSQNLAYTDCSSPPPSHPCNTFFHVAFPVTNNA
jgi:hypothetical protein